MYVVLDLGVSGNSYAAAIITGLLRTGGAFGGTLLLQFGVPRRAMLIGSGVLMGGAMYALSATVFHFGSDTSQRYSFIKFIVTLF